MLAGCYEPVSPTDCISRRLYTNCARSARGRNILCPPDQTRVWCETKHSIYLGRSAENSPRKNKKRAARGSEKTPVSNLNKRSFRVYQDLIYPLIGQFWQILSTLEHYWRRWDLRYGGGQRPFCEWHGVQICDKQHAKILLHKIVDLERENFFSLAIFRPAPQLTERLEEAHGIAR